MGKYRRRALVLPGVAASVTAARRFAASVARELGMDEHQTGTIALVASELATNAVEASPGLTYDLAIEVIGNQVRVEVTNPARGAEIPDRSQWGPDEPLALRGRGLQIVDQLSDRVELASDSRKVRVTATLGFVS
jgi:anti-sigma regulatory factor (Ser/Thr protein kinase)